MTYSTFRLYIFCQYVVIIPQLAMTSDKSTTLINIYVVKIILFSVNALSAVFLATFQHTMLSIPLRL